MNHKLTIALTENTPHSGTSEIKIETSEAGNLQALVDAFNAFLKLAGYESRVLIAGEDDERA